jgi:hypothetical protein
LIGRRRAKMTERQSFWPRLFPPFPVPRYPLGAIPQWEEARAKVVTFSLSRHSSKLSAPQREPKGFSIEVWGLYTSAFSAGCSAQVEIRRLWVKTLVVGADLTAVRSSSGVVVEEACGARGAYHQGHRLIFGGCASSVIEWCVWWRPSFHQIPFYQKGLWTKPLYQPKEQQPF